MRQIRKKKCPGCGRLLGIDKEDVKDICQLLQEGITISEIARIFGCSRAMIYHIREGRYHPEWVEEAQEAHESNEL